MKYFSDWIRFVMNYFWIFLLFDISNLFAQNFVSNPSFEDTIECPSNLDQLDRALGWSSFGQSPDYFNSCAVYGSFSGVPLNQFDFQNPRTGTAYAGFFNRTITSINYREYVGAQLTQPLLIGSIYYASFYVVRVSNSIQHKNIGSNKIGMLFSTVPFTSMNAIPMNNYSQIYTDSIIVDTLNWIKVEGYLLLILHISILVLEIFFQIH